VRSRSTYKHSSKVKMAKILLYSSSYSFNLCTSVYYSSWLDIEIVAVLFTFPRYSEAMRTQYWKDSLQFLLKSLKTVKYMMFNTKSTHFIYTSICKEHFDSWCIIFSHFMQPVTTEMNNNGALNDELTCFFKLPHTHWMHSVIMMISENGKVNGY
jgi:hypothetical protein